MKESNTKQVSISLKSILNKNLVFRTRMRPKMHYKIERSGENGD